MDVRLDLVPESARKSLPAEPAKLPFGRVFSDHMFLMEYSGGRWHSPRVQAYGPLSLDPAASVLHYGQEAFEGLKAYRAPDGGVLLFRPLDNARRLNGSLRRLCIPEIPEGDFLDAVLALLKADGRWVPGVPGTSAYLRPTVVATEAALGVKPSDSYLFYVLLSPVGPYFPQGFQPVGLLVSEDLVRAAPGGTGEAKVGGNYAASLLAAQRAKAAGWDQVLWLDAAERKYVEEAGAMNVFWVDGGTLVTPEFSGSILHGITRDSVIKLAASLGIPVTERKTAVADLAEGIRAGRVTEVFGSGTAAVISPVGRLGYRGETLSVADGRPGPVATRLYAALTAIQNGAAPDAFGWTLRAGEGA